MTNTDWIVVAALLVGGILLAFILSRLAFAAINSERRPEPVRQAAGAVRSLVLWLLIVVTLIAVLGRVSPASLERLPQDAIAFAPKVLSAVIIVIVANVLTSFAVASVAPMLGRASNSARQQVLSLIKGSILVFAVILAVRQLGVDTTIINLALGAVFFGLAAAFAALVAFGGRHVATEVASLRAARRLIQPGDQIKVVDLEGSVTNLYPTAIEILTADGMTVLMPASRLVTETVTIERANRN